MWDCADRNSIDSYRAPYRSSCPIIYRTTIPLWYASALEGCACAFVTMANTGGHGVDKYLENNFQLPEEIMALAIARGVAAGVPSGDGRGKTMTVDRTKTTLPQAVTALVACCAVTNGWRRSTPVCS